MENTTTNPAKLPWPQDQSGMTGQLKREGCRAIGRMGGDPSNFDIVMQVLRVLAHHAEAKLNEQRNDREMSLLILARKQIEQQAVSDRSAAGMSTALVHQRDSLNRRIQALADRKAKAEADWQEVLRKRLGGEEDNSQEDAKAEQGIGPATR